MSVLAPRRWIPQLPALGLFLVFCVGTLLPLWMLAGRALADGDGVFVGLANFARYFRDPGLFQSLWNTILVSGATALLATASGFVYAWGTTRTAVPGRGTLRLLAMTPLFAPTLLYGIALIYLFGNQGLATTGCFGHLPSFSLPVYGPVGIVLSEWIATFPACVLLLSVGLALSDRRLLEAARGLGAGPWRIFATVTLPAMRGPILSAFLASFAGAFTDFGAPKVLGGSFRVLSVEIYKQVAGLQNLPMGAAISLLLALPTLLFFLLGRKGRDAREALDGCAVTAAPHRDLLTKTVFTCACWGMAMAILAVDLTVVYASFVRTWPYDLRLCLRHYDFSEVAGFGAAPFATSLRMALLTAIFGGLLAFVTAWILERTRLVRPLQRLWRFLSLLPLALPGMVIGLAYVFFFNAPRLGTGIVSFPNPFHFLYGGMTVLVAATVWHFFPVALLSCGTALRRLDPATEDAARTLGAPAWRTMLDVALPLGLPALLEASGYLFVNAMITVSALVFLFSPELRPAALSVVDMEDAGDTAAAAAMGSLLLATNLAALLLRELAVRLWTRRHRSRI